MKYCIRFYGKQNKIFDEVDEIIIDISKIKNLDDLNEFCELHKQQRIILKIPNCENFDLITYAYNFQKKYQEYNISIQWFEYTKWYNEYKEKFPNSKVFFSTPVTNWDTLLFFNNLDITDIYIAEELGFELKQIKNIIKNTIQIRVFPNVAQAARQETSGIFKFWIRPEDRDFYEKYVDVYEFFGAEEKQNIYYNIYKYDTKWLGNLNELIIDLNEDINNMTLLPRFTQKRISCGRKCLKGERCNICSSIINLSKNLEKANLRIAIKEEE